MGMHDSLTTHIWHLNTKKEKEKGGLVPFSHLRCDVRINPTAWNFVNNFSLVLLLLVASKDMKTAANSGYLWCQGQQYMKPPLIKLLKHKQEHLEYQLTVSYVQDIFADLINARFVF